MTDQTPRCDARLTAVLDPDNPTHLTCDLTAGHDGFHEDGTTQWGKAPVEYTEENARG